TNGAENASDLEKPARFDSLGTVRHIACVALALFACASLGCSSAAHELRPNDAMSAPEEWATPAFHPVRSAERAPPESVPSTRGDSVAYAAARLVGLDSLSSVTRAYPDDCTGLVRAAYAHVGFDLLQD